MPLRSDLLLKKDRISFKYHLYDVYRKLPISNELKNRRYEWSEALWKFLDDIAMEYADGTTRTRKSVLDVFGTALRLIHIRKRVQFQDGGIRTKYLILRKFKLVDSLWRIFLVIQGVADINRNAIEELMKGLKPR